MALAADVSLDQTVIMPRPAGWPSRSGRGRLQGRTLGHYEVGDLLGRGSFGEVYRATDARLGRDVAIKVAEPSVAADPALREHLRNEARIQARLEHANIVPIYDLVEEEDHLFIVMRLIPGEDLDQAIRRGPFEPFEALHVMRQVCAALATAHGKGVIHQDMKPGNIRITPSGEAILLDFGVAQISGRAGEGRRRPSGTPAYMSPEQIRGEIMDARSDIYSLAMTMYKTLTGHHPFEDARDLAELLVWQVDRDPPAPGRFNPDIPAALADAILQGLAKSPRERFRGCADFLHALSAALGERDAALVDHADGRWNPRAPVNFQGSLTVTGQDPVDIQLVDLSITGAAMRVPGHIPVGARAALEIRIPIKGSEYALHCGMRVQRASPDANSGATVAGVAFEDVGSFDQLVLRDLVQAVLIYRST